MLGALPEAIVSELLLFWQENKDQDILTTSIKLRKERNIPMEGDEALSGSYSQVALQELKQGGDAANPKDFTWALQPKIVRIIEDMIGPAHRMRISALQADASIPEHIDNPEQIRIIILLEGEQEFTLQTKTESQHIEMKIGELWFVNTAWPHSVMNKGPHTRLALLIDLAEMPQELSKEY